MSVQTVRIPENLAKRLARLSKSSRRSKSSFIIEALEHFLDEREDLDLALVRIRDPETVWLDHDAVKRELDID